MSLKVQFIKSSSSWKECPKDDKPEIAFIGRSNVGKSSLINAICKKKDLAKTSSTPGKTQLINHYLIDDRWFLVDLPGYGYAKVSIEQRKKFQKRITDYLLKREQLALVCVLVDSRHPPQKIDMEFIHWLGENGIPLHIVFTKADKNKPKALEQNVENYLKELSDSWEELPKHFVTSAATKVGVDELRTYLQELSRSIGGTNN